KPAPAPVPASAAASVAPVAAVRQEAPPPATGGCSGLLPARFRLRRWPAADALLAHRYGHRLASFLSQGEMSLAELSHASNVEPGQCRQFLSDMLSRGWLDVVDASAAVTGHVPLDLPLAAAPVRPRTAEEPADVAAGTSRFGPDSVWLQEVAPGAVGLFRRLRDLFKVQGRVRGPVGAPDPATSF
ncbi:hypothetical protein, partial [Ideonella livida]